MVELALEPFAPIQRTPVRSVHTRRAEIDEPGFVGVGRADVARPSNRLIRHVLAEVVALLRRSRLRYRRRVAVKRRVVLIGLALIEAVEILEALTRRPVV